MRVKNLIRRIYAPEHLNGGEWLGPSYSTKEVYSTLTRLAWPAMLETVMIGMVSFIDTIMVGTLGPAAIAAVGITNQPRLLFFAVFFALSIGVTTIVSRRRGQENKEGANLVLAQSLSICAILSIVLCVIAFAFARPLIYFAGGQDDTIDMAVTYFKITMVGTVFTALGLMINSAHRGCGNTKISMYTNLTANSFNILFNWILINGIWFFPRLEVKGAAIATLIGNVASFLISVYSVSRKGGYLQVRLKNLFKFDMENLKLISSIGSSAMVEQVFIRIGFFLFVKIVASLGTQAMATHQIAQSILSISFTFGDGISIATSALVGQNLGRKRSDMATVYGRASQRVGSIISIILALLFITGGEMIMGLFTDDAAIIKQGATILVIIAISAPAQISQVIYTGALRGGGDTKFTAYMSLIAIGIFRPLGTYILIHFFNVGLIGAWIVMLLDQYLRLTLSALRFKSGKWKVRQF